MNLYGGLEVARQMQQKQEEGHVNPGLEPDLGGQENTGNKDIRDIQRAPSVRVRYQERFHDVFKYTELFCQNEIHR